ncbi:MAG: nucleotidyltransferase domain-containing protein [Desulfuromonadaceae bacterium]|nr:nucleotidyltransferase domain-containing protein [Desulfuromonadaceae bacterium]
MTEKKAEKKILEASRPPVSVLDFSREELLRFLRLKLADKPIVEAFLFGSVAAGTAGPWSDVDVLIVKQTELPFVERGREFFDLQELGVAVDVLVYTPHELAAMKRDSSPFWREVGKSLLKIC